MVSHSPSPILGAAVNIGAIFQKVPHNVEPASGTRFMQGTVTCIVSVVHVTDFVFQAIQDNFLWGEEMGCVDHIKKKIKQHAMRVMAPSLDSACSDFSKHLP